jgi:hypothetical protein
VQALQVEALRLAATRLVLDDHRALCRLQDVALQVKIVLALCRPGTGCIEQAFADYSVCSVAVVCSERALEERWRQRNWDHQLAESVKAELRWYQENRSRFACVVVTTGRSAEESAETLRACCAAPE